MGQLGAAGVLLALFGMVSAQGMSKLCSQDGDGSFYDFSAEKLDGSGTINFKDYSGKQEPGANATEIYNTIKYVRPGNGFVPKFQLFKKVEVNGGNASVIYKYLK
ncbi:unnamed protein product, partial [Notodromas monacha]